MAPPASVCTLCVQSAALQTPACLSAGGGAVSRAQTSGDAHCQPILLVFLNVLTDGAKLTKIKFSKKLLVETKV